jgi:hypothetical protein
LEFLQFALGGTALGERLEGEGLRGNREFSLSVVGGFKLIDEVL